MLVTAKVLTVAPRDAGSEHKVPPELATACCSREGQGVRPEVLAEILDDGPRKAVHGRRSTGGLGTPLKDPCSAKQEPGST